jgi:putative ABC transport system ATP-binding protein
MEVMTLFSLKNIDYKNIIQYPDIEIYDGSVTFICGESGSGKSTLLKLLNGVISPTGGVIFYHGKNIEEYDPIKLRRDVLLISQSVFLFDLTIKDNFNHYYAYRDLPVLSDDEVKKYLDICTVNLPLDSPCNVLSGGERQRIFMAVHLSLKPKVLMLDEPTSALDDKNANALIENIKLFCKQNNQTLLIVSHDKSIANQYADRTINLTGGIENV